MTAVQRMDCWGETAWFAGQSDVEFDPGGSTYACSYRSSAPLELTARADAFRYMTAAQWVGQTRPPIGPYRSQTCWTGWASAAAVLPVYALGSSSFYPLLRCCQFNLNYPTTEKACGQFGVGLCNRDNSLPDPSENLLSDMSIFVC